MLSGFQFSVVKPKPVTTDANSAMDQSEFEANTRDRCQARARETACEQILIGFGLASYWLRKWREFF